MRHPGLASWMLGIGLSLDVAGFASAAAEPLPSPSVDYRARARALQGIELSVAHHAGQLRVEVKSDNLPNPMVSLIDLSKDDMIVLMDLPGMDRIAVEMDLPPGFSYSDPKREGKRTGSSQVLGEACDLWQFRAKSLDQPVESCITADGIALRTTTAVGGKPMTLFEVLELERAPQAPDDFVLPKGVKPRRLPSGIRGLLPDLVR